MRYALPVLLICLTLLVLPCLLPGPGDQPRITPQRALESPLAYAAAFEAQYRPWLAALPGQAPVAAPPEGGIHHWTDAQGITHFSDRPPGTPAHQSLVFFGLTLAATVILTLLAVALFDLASGLWRHLAQVMRDRQDRGDTDHATPTLLAPIDFDDRTDLDPYSVLGISAKASNRNIRGAYERLRERCLPANIQHLDPSAQEGARHKAAAIEQAWQRICQERGIDG